MALLLYGRPVAAGVPIPWGPRAPTQPPTIGQAPPQAINPADAVGHTFDEELTEELLPALKSALASHADCFAVGTITGRTNIVTHRIDTGAASPIRQRPQSPAH